MATTVRWVAQSREGFLPALHWSEFVKNRSCHMNVGGDNKSQGVPAIMKPTPGKSSSLSWVLGAVRELEELREVTVEVVDHTGTTEIGVWIWPQCGSCICRRHKPRTQPPAFSGLSWLMRVL